MYNLFRFCVISDKSKEDLYKPMIYPESWEKCEANKITLISLYVTKYLHPKEKGAMVVVGQP